MRSGAFHDKAERHKGKLRPVFRQPAEKRPFDAGGRDRRKAGDLAHISFSKRVDREQNPETETAAAEGLLVGRRDRFHAATGREGRENGCPEVAGGQVSGDPPSDRGSGVRWRVT